MKKQLVLMVFSLVLILMFSGCQNITKPAPSNNKLVLVGDEQMLLGRWRCPTSSLYFFTDSEAKRFYYLLGEDNITGTWEVDNRGFLCFVFFELEIDRCYNYRFVENNGLNIDDSRFGNYTRIN